MKIMPVSRKGQGFMILELSTDEVKAVFDALRVDGFTHAGKCRKKKDIDQFKIDMSNALEEHWIMARATR